MFTELIQLFVVLDYHNKKILLPHKMAINWEDDTYFLEIKIMRWKFKMKR